MAIKRKYYNRTNTCARCGKIFPKSEIIKRRYIAMVKSPMDTRGTTSIIPWYEQFRIKDEDTLKIVNDIFNDIIGDT